MLASAGSGLRQWPVRRVQHPPFREFPPFFAAKDGSSGLPAPVSRHTRKPPSPAALQPVCAYGSGRSARSSDPSLSHLILHRQSEILRGFISKANSRTLLPAHPRPRVLRRSRGLSDAPPRQQIVGACPLPLTASVAHSHDSDGIFGSLSPQGSFVSQRLASPKQYSHFMQVL